MKMKDEKNKKINNVLIKIGGTLLYVALLFILQSTNVFATDDPLTVINNLKDFMYQIINGIGAILLLWGIVQVGMAIKSHDPTQRANGFLGIAGGVIIAFAKQILELIMK